MSDRFFYPFIVLLVSAIIAAALFAGGPLKSPGKTPEQISAEGFTAAGEDLRRFVNAPGTSVNYAMDSAGKTGHAILSAHLSKAAAPPSAGVFVTLGPDYEAAFGGKTLEVTVRAKAGGDNPSDRFLLQYFTASVGDSEEQIFALTGQYQDYTITYKTNPPAGEPGSDYVGMWPDIDGQNRTMDVERISVKVIE